MVTTQLESETAVEWLNLARKRIDLPENILKMNYQGDVDLLVIRVSDKPSVRGSMDYENDVIYNFDENDNLVSLEILDLYGVFADA
ncbi:MAG TPA: DUF2283 domain-containing protein [Pyrinomonadaceae bacterium]|nr:DUF2283 domain-containing protein [Pyrinomonadaceae bacterium]